MLRALLIALALALLLAACGGDETAPPTATPTPVPLPTQTEPGTSATPTPSPSPAPSPTETEAAEVGVDYYLLRDHPSGPWLEPVRTTVTPPAVARGALEALLNPSPPPTGDLGPVAPAGTTLNDVDLQDDGTLTVDLSLGEDGIGASYEQALVDAIVLTGTQFDTVQAVQILLDGQQVESLYGHVDVSQPLTDAPFAIAPIVVEEVTVRGDVTVAGTANVFEATIELTLRGSDGQVLEETFTTATCGTGCRGEYSHTFTDVDPAGGTIVLREPDPSSGEGRPPYEVTVEY